LSARRQTEFSAPTPGFGGCGKTTVIADPHIPITIFEIDRGCHVPAPGPHVAD
jgi:hypothetical protein